MPGSEHNEIQIHIDQQQYESPNPTTGAALYSLGHIGAELQLYLVVNGHQEDEPIENGPEVVQLKNGELSLDTLKCNIWILPRVFLDFDNCA